mgnify:CR=1 FL=1
MKKLKNIIGIILIVILTNVVFFNYVKDDNKNLGEKAKTLNTSNVFQNLKNNSIQYFQNPDFTIAAEKTINSVVHVKNTSTARARNSIWDLFYDNSPNKRTVGTGSGVIVSSDGYILTNYHVIENASEIEITTNNNKSYIAELIGTDENSDIAVLKISGDKKFPYIRFANSDETKIGEWVLAVGNPFNLTSTVTAGIISAKSRDLNDYDSKNQSFIQTDAAVNSGNSGGALVNISGDLIGINTAIQSNNAGFIGYSFAVPSNIARKIYEDILEFGNVQRGLLGVTGQSLNAEISKELDLKVTEGFYVSTTDEDMGAHLAGIRSGDIITKIDNVEIKKFSDLSGYLNSKRPGDQLSVDDKKEIGVNLRGYDISPEMIRLSLVNMYLNGFSTPRIEEYDTLSKDANWNEYFDIILANPPFFSPTGGIKPHSRFGVKSNRAEVLFVDYIIEHLKPNGRAGIIVPEGIIFQTGNAYKTLRKKLVEDCLIGVISLPAGVFQPYSGVYYRLICDFHNND